MRHNEILHDIAFSDYVPVTFGYEKCKAKHSYGPAVRSYWLLHYVVSGKGIFERDGEIHSVSMGEIFVIPPFLETYYEADLTEPWSYIWLGFTAKGNVAPSLSSPVLHCPEAQHIFEEMKLCSKKQNGKSEFLLAKLWELFSILSEEKKESISYVETAIRYMKSEYMNPISISELAHRLGIDRSYFSYLFKSEIGISPAKFLSNLRLSNASELLIKHGTSPTTAALSCGYSDIYHFSKAFKKHFGLSPRAYVEKHKK